MVKRMTDSTIERFLSLIQKAIQMQTMQNVVLSAPKNGEVKKIYCTLRKISENLCIQAEYKCSEGRVRQKNLSADMFLKTIAAELETFARADLHDSGGSASLLCSKKGKITLIIHGAIGSGEKQALSGNNRDKKYILDGSEAFLYHLGIANEKGRIHDKKQAKFRQINHFLELIQSILKELPPDGTLYVADLCCGKSYLSFAAYYFFANILNRTVEMDCVDLKESVMLDCARIASLCSFTGMHFRTGDISKYTSDKAIHLLISLHACDTATDLVLDRGIALGAKVILATPCCHRQLSRKLDCSHLSFISRHPVLKYKFCDAATDALRILRLEACGYTCDALEFTDPENTPKNVLIRAVKRDTIDYKRSIGEDAQMRYRKAWNYLTQTEPAPFPTVENKE